MKENIVLVKSYDFSRDLVNGIRRVELSYYNKNIISQLLKSGTSIGANINEAQSAESKKDFVHKMKVANKEINETEYWLKLLCDTERSNQEFFEELKKRNFELRLLVNKIIVSCKIQDTI